MNRKVERQARERANTGVYHIIMRGINRQDLFYDNDDYLRFLDRSKWTDT
ncbi:MAG: hypothetical protein ACM3UZ_06300 [Acidobacteriota bacterium]